MNRLHESWREACSTRHVDNRATYESAVAAATTRQRRCRERIDARCARRVPRGLEREGQGDVRLVECGRDPLVGSVVDTALALWVQYPHAPAIEILDRAMQLHEADDDLQRALDEELEPPHPFAELLRRAFAPHMHEMELWLEMFDVHADTHDPKLQARLAWVRGEWDLAVLKFSERYGLW